MLKQLKTYASSPFIGKHTSCGRKENYRDIVGPDIHTCLSSLYVGIQWHSGHQSTAFAPLLIVSLQDEDVETDSNLLTPYCFDVWSEIEVWIWFYDNLNNY